MENESPKLFNREPALVISAVGALLALAIGFGLDITEAQRDLAMSAIIAVVGVMIRSQVSPANQDV